MDALLSDPWPSVVAPGEARAYAGVPPVGRALVGGLILPGVGEVSLAVPTGGSLLAGATAALLGGTTALTSASYSATSVRYV